MDETEESEQEEDMYHCGHCHFEWPERGHSEDCPWCMSSEHEVGTCLKCEAELIEFVESGGALEAFDNWYMIYAMARFGSALSGPGNADNRRRLAVYLCRCEGHDDKEAPVQPEEQCSECPACAVFFCRFGDLNHFKTSDCASCSK